VTFARSFSRPCCYMHQNRNWRYVEDAYPLMGRPTTQSTTQPTISFFPTSRNPPTDFTTYRCERIQSGFELAKRLGYRMALYVKRKHFVRIA